MPKQILELEVIFDEKGVVTGLKKIDGALDKNQKNQEKNNKKNKKGLLDTIKRWSILGSTIGNLVSGAISKFFSVVKQGFVASIKLASQFEEANSKFNVVFRGVENRANELRKELVGAYKLSTIEATKLLAGTQDLFVPLGLARDKAADLSGEVVKLARDIGSFNDLPTSDVLRDIQSALVGNFETTRKYGVVLSETTIKQKIYEETGEKVKGTVDAQTKALTALKLIQEGSADAQGDAIRTADSFANKQRSLSAAFEDLGVAIGESFKPAAQETISILDELTRSVTGYIQEQNKAFASLIGAEVSEDAEALFTSIRNTAKEQANVKVGTDALIASQKQLNKEIKDRVADREKLVELNKEDAKRAKQIFGNANKRIKIRNRFIGTILTEIAEREGLREAIQAELKAREEGSKAAVEAERARVIEVNEFIKANTKQTTEEVILDNMAKNLQLLADENLTLDERTKLLQTYTDLEKQLSEDRIAQSEKESDDKIANARRVFAMTSGTIRTFAKLSKQILDQNIGDEKERAKESAKIAKALFTLQKGVALGEIGMNTATAITSALTLKPFIPVGLAASILAGSKGIAQAAVVLGQTPPKLGSFQFGGRSAGGQALVGEAGPELVDLPGGSRVFNNREASNMLNGGIGAGNINNTTNNNQNMGKSFFIQNAFIQGNQEFDEQADRRLNVGGSFT